MKARIALAVVAVAVLAVLGFWLRASMLESRAYDVSLNAFQVTKPGPLAQARSDYRRAERHNPDQPPNSGLPEDRTRPERNVSRPNRARITPRPSGQRRWRAA